MALWDRIQAREAEKAKATEEAAEKLRLLRKRGADRNIRDAYFHGLVFAACANDDEGKVDDSERHSLESVASGLSMSSRRVSDIISRVSTLNDDEKMDLIKEVLGNFQDANVAEFFLYEFSGIWELGGGTSVDLAGFKTEYFDKFMPQGVVAELKKRSELLERRRKEEEEKKREVESKLTTKADAFYKTVNSFPLGENTISLKLLETARAALVKEGYESMGTGMIWVSIHKAYIEEVTGRTNVDTFMPQITAGASAFAIALAATLPVSLFGIGGALATGLAAGIYDSAKKQRLIRRRAIWALACLYALGEGLNESSLYPFNELLRRVEAVPYHKVESDEQNDPFWKEEIEPALCRWLGVSPL